VLFSVSYDLAAVPNELLTRNNSMNCSPFKKPRAFLAPAAAFCEQECRREIRRFDSWVILGVP
jgi:hypothetical protein